MSSHTHLFWRWRVLPSTGCRAASEPGSQVIHWSEGADTEHLVHFITFIRHSSSAEYRRWWVGEEINVFLYLRTSLMNRGPSVISCGPKDIWWYWYLFTCQHFTLSRLRGDKHRSYDKKYIVLSGHCAAHRRASAEYGGQLQASGGDAGGRRFCHKDDRHFNGHQQYIRSIKTYLQCAF